MQFFFIAVCPIPRPATGFLKVPAAAAAAAARFLKTPAAAAAAVAGHEAAAYLLVFIFS